LKNLGKNMTTFHYKGFKMSDKQFFDKVLIANRGEIALRVIKSLKRMNIKSVAVYSEADSNSLHVMQADEAIFIGNSAATESYLSIENIIWAARSSGASAIHPGYGFLSENYNFAKKLESEGIVLIGPSSNAIRQMGDKVEAKKIAESAGVNTVPGYIGTIDDYKGAIKIAEQIGFPVLVKAVAGGGGRGMRIVNNADQMESAYESAHNEALYSFNDGRLFIEKYITKPRHIEIQVIADMFGNIVCLGERECSIQKNHQKVIEEAPSCILTEEIRQKMYAQSIRLAKAVKYHSAGTVEFIMDSTGEFYFLEMNTRLQVEHPVTELVTGIDIVEEMIRIAAKQKLSFSQEDIKINGVAIEARICAEDPLRGFLPSVGRITKYSEPLSSEYVRVDSGVAAGSEVSMFYDPMIAKLCIYSDTRSDAIEKMKAALGSYIIQGITHNMTFLEAIMNNENFAKGEIHTGFIKEEFKDGVYAATLTSETTEIFIATSIHIFLVNEKRAAKISDQIVEQYNRIPTRWVVIIDDKTYPVIISPVSDGFRIRTQHSRLYVRSNWALGSTLFKGIINGCKVNVKIKYIKTGYELTHAGVSVKAYVRSLKVSQLDNIMKNKVVSEDKFELYAPLTGKVISVKVKEGDSVEKGQDLITLTAMKLENIISAESSGKIKSVHVNANDNVDAGQLLIEFE
jgi:propionyl-CoA carboxylase alpha chain